MAFPNPIKILSNGGLQAPSIGNTIPTIPLISARNYFLQSLESWIATPSMSTQWIAIIERFPQQLNEDVLQTLELVSGDKKGWNVPKTELTNFFLQKTIGCVFCQGFEAPKQRMETVTTNLDSRGFYAPAVGGRRLPMEPLVLSFLETNLSFVDGILRPWSILAGHKGLVARTPEEDIKTNIHIFQYAKTASFLSQVPRKIWSFYDCVPINIGGGSYNYTKENVEIKSNVQFAYNWYQMANTTYIPIPDLIDKLTSGQLFDDVLGTITVGSSIKKVAKNPVGAIAGIGGSAVLGALGGG